MSSVARGVQEVLVHKGWFPRDDRWAWQAFLQNGDGAVFCNHAHKTAPAAVACSRRMAKAGGHPILAADKPRRRSSHSHPSEHGGSA